MNQTNSDDRGDEAVVRKVLELIGALKVEEALAYVADDLVLELPLRHDGGPQVMNGEAARRFVGSIPKLFSRMNFTEITVHGRAPNGIVAAEYRSNGLTRAGQPYVNSYAGFFEVRGGKIARWREYFDPVVIRAAFNLA